MSKNKNAAALSKLGAAKGGKARANVLTKEERSEIARKAVRARWVKAGKTFDDNALEDAEAAGDRKTADSGPKGASMEKPYAMFAGKVHLGPLELEAYVLSDGRRVFKQREASYNTQDELLAKDCLYADNPGQALLDERDRLRIAVATPEKCAGVVTEAVERDRDAAWAEVRRLRAVVGRFLDARTGESWSFLELDKAVEAAKEMEHAS